MITLPNSEKGKKASPMIKIRAYEKIYYNILSSMYIKKE